MSSPPGSLKFKRRHTVDDGEDSLPLPPRPPRRIDDIPNAAPANVDRNKAPPAGPRGMMNQHGSTQRYQNYVAPSSVFSAVGDEKILTSDDKIRGNRRPSSADHLFAIFDSSKIHHTRNILDQVTKQSSENSSLKPYLVEWLDEFKDWFDHAPAETLLADEASLLCASIALLRLRDPVRSLAFLSSLRTKLERPECQGKYALEQILFQTLQSIESETFQQRGGGTIVADLIALSDQLLKRLIDDAPYVYSSTYTRYIPRLCSLFELFIHLGNLEHAEFSLEQLKLFLKKLDELCLAATSVDEPYPPFVYQLERIRALLSVMEKASVYNRRQRLAYVGHGLVGLLYSVQIVRAMVFELKIDRDSVEGATNAFKSMKTARGLPRQTSSSDLLRNLHALTIAMLSTTENSTTDANLAPSLYFEHLPNVLALKIKDEKERIYFRYGLIHQLTSLATGLADTSLREKSVEILVSQIYKDDWTTDPAVTHALLDGLCCIAARNEETEADYIHIKRSIMALSNSEGLSSSSADGAAQKGGLFRRLGNGSKRRLSTSSSSFSSASSLFQKWLGSEDLPKKIFSFRPIEARSMAVLTSEADAVFRQVGTRISTKRLSFTINDLRADMARGLARGASGGEADNSPVPLETAPSVEQVMVDGVSELVKRLKVNPTSLAESERIAMLSRFIAEGAKNATLASNQELVLVLGMSGAGKSTFLNYLFGCTMRMDFVHGRRQVSVDYVNGKEEAFKIGHDGSETLLPHLHAHAHGANPSVVYCDCPGFSDTRGAVVNIANAVNIRAALQCSKGAKVIILVPYKDIDARSHGFKSTIDTCKQLFGSTSKLLEHSNAVLFGITRVDMNDHDSRPSKHVSVATIKQQLRGAWSFKADPVVRALLSGEIGMFLHDPLDNGRMEKGFWSHAECIKKITQLSSIPSPASVFKTTLNAGDERELSLISRTTQEQIRDNFSNKSYSQAAVRMRNLEQLSVVDHPVVSRLLTETHNKLEDEISRQVATFREECLANRFDAAEAMLSEFQFYENHFPEESNRLRLHYLPSEYEREMKNYEDRQQSAREVEALRVQVAAGTVKIKELVDRLEEEKQRVQAERNEVEERHTAEIALLRKEMSLTRSNHEEQIKTINASLEECADELDKMRTAPQHDQLSNTEEKRRLEEELARLKEELVAAQQAQAAATDRVETALANQKSLMQNALAQKDDELAKLSSQQSQESQKLLGGETKSKTYPASSTGGNFVWKGRRSPICSAPRDAVRTCRLDCPTVKIGCTCRWTIRIEKGGSFIGLGIALSSHQLDLNTFLGYQRGGWSYKSDGSVWHNRSKTKSGLSSFGAGDKVRLTLDLSKGQKGQRTGGTLTVSIEGKSKGKEFVLFKNIMRDCRAVGLNLNNDVGFYPTVSGHNGARISFVGFDSVK